MVIVGIDPGLDGAIAFLGEHSASVHDLPTKPIEGGGTVTRRIDSRALRDLLRLNVPAGEGVLAVLEELTVGGQGSSQQTIGSQYRTRGAIETVLELLGLDVRSVRAQKWKGLYGLTKEKKPGRLLACELYPALADQLQQVKDHNRAEAVLIAHWARKVLA